MKNYTLKKVIPLFVVLLSVFTALATSKPETAKLTLIQGYIRSNPLGTDCVQSIMCSDVVSNICTVNGQPNGIQVWGKNAAGRCIIELYKIP